MMLSSPRLNRLRALVRKESLQIIRDPSSILIAFVLPAILLFLSGYALSLDATHNRIGLVIEAPSPQARDLASAFRASRYFDVIEGRDRREFEEALIIGAVKGVVVVPALFTADITAKNSPVIQVLVDGSDPNTAGLVQNYVRGVVQGWGGMSALDAPGKAPTITAELRFWFNPDLASRNFLVPGSIVIIMTLVGSLLTSLVVAREWERGTMEALMATPVTGVEMLVGKTLPYFVLGLLSMTLCVIISILVFGVPFRGSVAALYLLSTIFLIPALGQGLLISALTKNQFIASQVALISAFLPAFILSGFIFEVSSMPVPIRMMSRVLPAYHVIPSIQSVFLAGDVWGLFLVNIAALLVIGAVFFGITLRNSRKRIG